MHIAVIGAGLAGVTSAWYLARDGHRVTLIDRREAAGLETSFANGGQLSVSHPEPWANPHAPANILRWLGREDAPLKFRPRADLDQWRWGLAFLRECLPSRTRRNTEAIAALALYSIGELRKLRAETGIQYDSVARGILHLYFDRNQHAAHARRAEQLRRFGMQVELCTPERCIDIEPALATSLTPPAGGLYAPDDESGDAHLFTQGLAALCLQAGVETRFGFAIEKLNAEGALIKDATLIGPDGQRETFRADAYVLAAGSESPRLMKPLGQHLAIYPVKGYSVTLPAGPFAPQVSITDEARRMVFSRLGDRLRVAGTAELNGYDKSISMARAQAILDRTLELFPEAGDATAAQFWAGLRPAVPSNRPYIGRSPFDNLYYNTGHGTLGWTLSCGSSRALADIIRGQYPAPNFPFLNR